MSVQSIGGSFPTTFLQAAVINDNNPAGAGTSAWTSGAQRAIDIIGPTLTEEWMILGFTLRAVMSYYFNVRNYWARFGDLWAGPLIDLPIKNIGGNGVLGTGVRLPVNITTLAKVWDGVRDPPPPLGNAVFIPPGDSGILSTSQILPMPLSIRSGQQLQFGLFLTPSLASEGLGLSVVAADFSLIYDDGR